MLRTTDAVPAGSRATEEPINQDVGEEVHCCGYCGTRTVETTWTDSDVQPQHCPHCQQRYNLTDELEDPDEAMDGEIEIVDERTGVVTGMTSSNAGADTTASLIAGIRDFSDRWHQKPTAPLPEASQEDLNHLFGIEPSPYGDKFGSF